MNRLFWLVLIMVLVAFDQYSKYLVETMLPLQEPISVIPTLSLYRTYNYGVAFSMLAGLNGWPLNILTIGIIGFVIWLWRGLEPGRWLSSLGYALVVGGAVGNLIDRVHLGKVVDMIFFHIESLNFQFAVFNLADVFISLGAGAIILDEILIWHKSRQIDKAVDKEMIDE